MYVVKNVVTVVKGGHVVIPPRLRKKLHIKEGTKLVVVETEEGVLFKPITSIWDLAGMGSEFATAEEVKKELEKLREQDALSSL